MVADMRRGDRRGGDLLSSDLENQKPNGDIFRSNVW